ncbi:MAG: hypothetical protein ACRDRI_25525 [Pseudonocardiaceae bacterium]
MSEPTSDALFGNDGTELPDPSGRAGWRDAPGLPPLTLPAIPDLSMTREAIAATLGADPAGPVDQDPGAAPAQRPAAVPSTPPAQVTPAQVAPAQVAQEPATQANMTAPLPIPSAPQAGGPPPAGSPGQRARPFAAAQPAAPPPRGPSGSRFRPPLAIGSRTPVRLGDLRRRISLQATRLPLPARADGGAAVFFFIAAIVCGILTYSIILGIVDSIVRLFQ